MTPRVIKSISKYENEDTVLNSVRMAIKCPKPRFYPNKSYGSRLSVAMSNDELLARSRCACEGLDGVFIKSVSADENTITLTVMINDNERSVSVDFE